MKFKTDAQRKAVFANMFAQPYKPFNRIDIQRALSKAFKNEPLLPDEQYALNVAGRFPHRLAGELRKPYIAYLLTKRRYNMTPAQKDYLTLFPNWYNQDKLDNEMINLVYDWVIERNVSGTSPWMNEFIGKELKLTPRPVDHLEYPLAEFLTEEAKERREKSWLGPLVKAKEPFAKDDSEQKQDEDNIDEQIEST
jgi:hypothetical protein